MGWLGVSDIRFIGDRGLDMWKCDNCGALFDEPEVERESYEGYYGVSGMFSDRHYFSIEVCPSCGSEDIDSYCEEEDELEGAIWED